MKTDPKTGLPVIRVGDRLRWAGPMRGGRHITRATVVAVKEPECSQGACYSQLVRIRPGGSSPWVAFVSRLWSDGRWVFFPDWSCHWRPVPLVDWTADEVAEALAKEVLAKRDWTVVCELVDRLTELRQMGAF